MANDLDQSVSNAIASGVSAPVDLIAWLLRKGGLPIDKPVMGSDWMKEKGLTKDVAQSPASIVGETVGNLVDPIGSITPAAKAILYAGALRGDILANHAVKASKLLDRSKVPQELYNPSFGITKNKLMDFDGGNVHLLPHLGKFDPASNPSVLTAIDSYSPRYNKASGHRVDDAFANAHLRYADEDGLLDPADISRYLRELGGRRIADKFVPKFAKGGIFGETSAKSDLRGLPQYGKGGYDVSVIEKPFAQETMHMQSMGPRFQSLRSYETSPRGAGRLDEGPDHNEMYGRITSFLNRVAPANKFENTTDELDALMDIAQRPYKTVQVEQARHLLQQLRTTKSDYGELKQYGPVQLSPHNFAGAIVNTEKPITSPSSVAHAAQMHAVIQGLRARGLPTYTHGGDVPDENLFEIADAIQRGTFKP